MCPDRSATVSAGSKKCRPSCAAALAVLGAALAACRATARVTPPPTETLDSPSFGGAGLPAARASLDAAAPLKASAPSHDAPQLTVLQAEDILFLQDDLPRSCEFGEDAARIRCLISARFAPDPRARAVALDLYDRTGDVAGLSPTETMEGGWRGTLHLVPALPIGKDRAHLEWIADATRDYDDFFESLVQGETKS